MTFARPSVSTSTSADTALSDKSSEVTVPCPVYDGYRLRDPQQRIWTRYRARRKVAAAGGYDHDTSLSNPGDLRDAESMAGSFDEDSMRVYPQRRSITSSYRRLRIPCVVLWLLVWAAYIYTTYDAIKGTKSDSITHCVALGGATYRCESYGPVAGWFFAYTVRSVISYASLLVYAALCVLVIQGAATHFVYMCTLALLEKKSKGAQDVESGLSDLDGTNLEDGNKCHSMLDLSN